MKKKAWLGIFSALSVLGAPTYSLATTWDTQPPLPDWAEPSKPARLPLGPDSCAQFIAQLPSSFHHDWIEVPEDWAHAEKSSKIKVFYYWRDAAVGTTPSPHPIIFFNGGPAASSEGSMALLEPNAEAQRHPFVYVDQRGTGCSSPYPAGWDKKAVAKIAHYGSRAIVRDSEAIREKLFGAKSRWIVFGQSYGGLIVHRYFEIAPQSIVGGFAHGFTRLGKDGTEFILARIDAVQRVFAEYLKSYPDDLARLTQIRAKVIYSQCWGNEYSKICGPGLLDTLTIYLGFRDLWPTLHQFYERLLLPGGTVNATLLQWMADHLALKGAEGLGAQTLFQMEVTPGATFRDSWLRAEKVLDQRGEKTNRWPLYEGRAVLATRQKSEDSAESLDRADPLDFSRIKGALDKKTVRLFVYSGHLDSIVPDSLFNWGAKEFKQRAVFRNFPLSGHDGYYSEPAVWTDIQSLDTLTR